MTDKYSDLVSLYRTKLKLQRRGNIELEIRFKDISKFIFEKVYKALPPDSDVADTKTINIIENVVVKDINIPMSMIIKEIKFDGGEKVETNTQKVKIRTINDCQLSYSVNLSEELPYTNLVTTKSHSIIRIKWRKSTNIVIDSVTWRLDLTVVYSLYGSDASRIKGIKDKVFGMTFDELMVFNETKHDCGKVSYEVEMELMPIDPMLLRSSNISFAIDHILTTINPGHSHVSSINTALQSVSMLLHGYKSETVSIKRILPSVVALTRNEYRAIYPPIDYFFTNKVDGKRSVMIIKGNKGVVVNDEIIEFIASVESDIVLDGEWLPISESIYGGKFMAFDIMRNGDPVTKLTFEGRIALLPQVTAAINQHFPCEMKKYIQIKDVADIESAAKTMVAMSNGDGLILVNPGSPYTETKTYKWKSLEHNTIDFLVKKAPITALGKPPFVNRPGFDIYLLFVGIDTDRVKRFKMTFCPGYNELFEKSEENYIPIQFSSTSAPYAYIYYHPTNSAYDISNRIVEMRCISDDTAVSGTAASSTAGVYAKWEIVSIRHDRDIDLINGRYFGNDYRIAELTWINYIDKFPLEELWNPSNVYFTSEKDDMYKNGVDFITHVKYKFMIEKIINMRLVIDICAGKGQDLHKYGKSKVHHLVAIDNDKAAISELVRRVMTNEKQHQYHMAINTIVGDMTKPQSVIQQLLNINIVPQSANAIVCNLAIHYLINSIESMQNLIAFMKTMLVKGGTVLITCFFGEFVHHLFELEKVNPGESWDAYENDVLKYSLVRKYTGDLAAAGQQIDVLLPFTKGEYYTENLVNTQRLTEEFKKFNFTLHECNSIGKYIDEYMGRKDIKFNEDDRKYLSLYGVLVYKLL
jgi:mRNA capping enzyme